MSDRSPEIDCNHDEIQERYCLNCHSILSQDEEIESLEKELQSLRAENERLKKDKRIVFDVGFEQEKRITSLEEALGKAVEASTFLADHSDYLISLLQKEESMQSNSKWGEVAHGFMYRISRLREALLTAKKVMDAV